MAQLPSFMSAYPILLTDVSFESQYSTYLHTMLTPVRPWLGLPGWVSMYSHIPLVRSESGRSRRQSMVLSSSDSASSLMISRLTVELGCKSEARLRVAVDEIRATVGVIETGTATFVSLHNVTRCITLCIILRPCAGSKQGQQGPKWPSTIHGSVAVRTRDQRLQPHDLKMPPYGSPGQVATHISPVVHGLAHYHLNFGAIITRQNSVGRGSLLSTCFPKTGSWGFQAAKV